MLLPVRRDNLPVRVPKSGTYEEILNTDADEFGGENRLNGSCKTSTVKYEDGSRTLVEVKGVTLEVEGRLLFPDAPTQRGIKHLEELAGAVDENTHCCALFVGQMKGVHSFAPNRATHPQFADALKKAADAGVQVLCYDCIVTPESMVLDAPVKVEL